MSEWSESSRPQGSHVLQLAGSEAATMSDIAALPMAYRLVESLAENGPKIVQMAPESARLLRTRRNDIAVAQVRRYRTALSPMRRVRSKGVFDGATGRTSVRIHLRVAGTDAPVEGALVVAVLDTSNGLGLPRRRSGMNGQVTLTFPGTQTVVQELFVYPRCGVWGFYGRDLALTEGMTIHLQPINFADPDLLQELIADSADDAGQNVRVGVVDSGVDGSHPDLNVAGGISFAPDSADAQDHGAGADGHGTHVAGIISGRARRGHGMRGVAPAAALFSYRVFPKDGSSTTNSCIMRAIHRAIEDRCDLINLSLGGGYSDPALNRVIGHAYDNGTVCIVAAGNDGRRAVSYPAWYKRALAISALGREGAFPKESTETAAVDAPRSANNPDQFIALFSNIGTEIDFTGPGVGIVSCFPSNRYAVMSGTSMACPAVTGVAATLLSQNSVIHRMRRGRNRAREIIDLVRRTSRDAGFPDVFQGFGLPFV